MPPDGDIVGTHLALGFARLVSIPVVAILLIFTIRRIVFTGAVLLGQKRRLHVVTPEPALLPHVLVLVPCRDEASMIPGLSQALRQLDYPRERLQVVLIDDGSSDGTGACMAQHAQASPGWHSIALPRNVGKASALNAALARFPFGEIVYIFDADHRPDAQVLRRAVRYFEDPQVAGVTGFTKVSNPIASPSAYYSTIESYTNQLVTMRAKDRLGLAPALLGSNCGYRRTALIACGGFRADAFSEDSDLTVMLYRSGYRVRFAGDAISYQQVPQSIRGYVRQHARWGRGLNEVARTHGLAVLRGRKLPLPLRLELLVFAAGYLDRLAIIGAVALSAFSFLSGGLFRFPHAILVLALLVPFAQVVALLIKERMHAAMWVRLPLIPLVFGLDIFAAAQAMWATLFDRSGLWTKTERVELLPDDDNRGLHR